MTEEETEQYYKDLLAALSIGLEQYDLGQVVQIPDYVKTTEDFIKWIEEQ